MDTGISQYWLMVAKILIRRGIQKSLSPADGGIFESSIIAQVAWMQNGTGSPVCGEGMKASIQESLPAGLIGAVLQRVALLSASAPCPAAMTPCCIACLERRPQLSSEAAAACDWHWWGKRPAQPLSSRRAGILDCGDRPTSHHHTALGPETAC
jgi:hypothetical protein